jgi:Mg2+ and Co2+ transporter CorA
LVDRIDTKLTTVNTKHTDRFAHVLSNLQAILDKISEDVDKTQAQAAIDAAKLAIENQAAKTYTITISSEAALRSNVGATTSGLRRDLMATHKLVIDAKQAVQKLRENSAMMKKEATSSANL